MLTSPMRIAIAPTKVKVDAAEAASAKARTTLGADVTVSVGNRKPGSGVPEQPIGLEEARVGASTRAYAALVEQPDATHALGIENCFVYLGAKTWVDLAVVVLIDKATNRETVTTSVGIPGPIRDLGLALTSNQDMTAGSSIAARTGWDGADWHAKLTGGEMGRAAILTEAVYAAILLALHPVGAPLFI